VAAATNVYASDYGRNDSAVRVPGQVPALCRSAALFAECRSL